MLVDHLPEARGIGIGGHALEHQAGRPVRQRAVDDIGVPGDPADIGGAPVHVRLLQVEDIFMGHRGPDEIAAGRVQHALGLSGRAGSIEDEERVFRCHRLGRAVSRDIRADLVQPEIAAILHGDITAGALDHQHLLDLDALMIERGIAIGFQRHLARAAQALIGGDHELGVAVHDPPGQGFGREAAEHDGVHRAYPGAGQHGIGRLQDHRHVDRDPVALPDAHLLQHIGELAHRAMQLAIGEGVALVRAVALPDQRRFVAACFQVPIDTVVGDVQDAVLVPFDAEIALFEAGVLGPGRLGEPVQPLGLIHPEPVRIGDGAGIHLLVGLRRQVCLGGEALRNCYYSGVRHDGSSAVHGLVSL